jgi:tripartite-type tricarboxylate transporter receptor subunit TctC
MAAGVVAAQEYPTKPVRIVTSVAGGGSDFMARQIAQGLTASLGQPVTVDNRASAQVGEVGSKTAADGYTLTVQGASLWLTPMLQPMTYDIERDFSTITMVARDAFILTTHPSLPVKSVKELIALAKSRPGELNYGASTAGGPPQLGMELLKSMTGVNIIAVPYKGTAPAFTAVVGGEVHMTVADTALVLPQVKAGKARALGVTTPEPTVLAPGLFTVASQGLPGFAVIGATGLWAPAKTSTAIITRVNQETVRFLNRPDVKEKFLSIQQEIVANSPEQFAATIKSEVAKWGKVFTALGIKRGV